MSNKKMIAALKRFRASLAKERDRLRDFREALDALDDVANRAIDDLDSAIWTLSEQV